MEAEFIQRLHGYKNLLGEAEFILRRGVDSRKIKTHAIVGRVKEFESFKGKVQRLDAKNPFDDVTDIVGLRVICLLRSDIPRIGEMIRSSFVVISEDNKIDGQEVSSFGYQSLHFVVAMKSEYSGPRYDNLKNISFEIQVRTVAMDAWATVSHYLDYKADSDVPKELRKDFYALSGLFYVVDSHFEIFYQAGERSRITASERVKHDASIQGEDLNIDTLRAYVFENVVDAEHNLVHIGSQDFSDLVRELISADYRKISDLHLAVNKGFDAFLEYERENPPANKKGGKFTAIGVVRVLISIVDENYLRQRNMSEEQAGIYRKYRYLVR